MTIFYIWLAGLPIAEVWVIFYMAERPKASRWIWAMVLASWYLPIISLVIDDAERSGRRDRRLDEKEPNDDRNLPQ